MQANDEQVKAFLPLTEPTFYILSSLCSPLHGYGVIQTVEAMSKGRVKLGPGTLYGAFQRMLKQCLIERLDAPGGENDRRKLYKLTALGRSVLRYEVDRLREMVAHGEQALAESEGSMK